MSYLTYNGTKIYFEEYGSGEPLMLLHGNTVSGKFFTDIISSFADNYHVIVMDFLGCGQSDRLYKWPTDLWYEWSRQVVALCVERKLSRVKLVGCSGGALVALNVALENPELVESIVADSFEGLKAAPELTEQIRIGRSFAKQNAEFSSLLRAMHGDDWENVFDADTEAVTTHAKTIGAFLHKSIDTLKAPCLLTGSAEDEMFPKDHYKMLFENICSKTNMAQWHIFEQGGHPSMMSNRAEFLSLCKDFFEEQK